MPCKIASVLCVIVHISTQSVVSLSAEESFQGAEEFTQSLDLSVGGIGNCKDKLLQRLKSNFLFRRAFGISQISQIQPCPRCYQKSGHAHFQRVLGKKDGDLECLCWGKSCRTDICQGVRCLTHLRSLGVKDEPKPFSSIMCHFLPLTCFINLFLP